MLKLRPSAYEDTIWYKKANREWKILAIYISGNGILPKIIEKVLHIKKGKNKKQKTKKQIPIPLKRV